MVFFVHRFGLFSVFRTSGKGRTEGRRPALWFLTARLNTLATRWIPLPFRIGLLGSNRIARRLPGNHSSGHADRTGEPRLLKDLQPLRASHTRPANHHHVPIPRNFRKASRQLIERNQYAARDMALIPFLAGPHVENKRPGMKFIQCLRDGNLRGGRTAFPDEKYRPNDDRSNYRDACQDPRREMYCVLLCRFSPRASHTRLLLKTSPVGQRLSHIKHGGKWSRRSTVGAQNVF